MTVLEAGVVGSLDYKIINAERADDLFTWLKDNKYSYSGDEATLNYYVKKKWVFTVMKIDTMQMKKNKDGTFAGEVTPTRFQLLLRQVRLSPQDHADFGQGQDRSAFYVQAPTKMDLQGDLSYQYNWVPMLQSASGCTPGGLPGGEGPYILACQGPDSRPDEEVQRTGLPFRPRPAASCRTRMATRRPRWNMAAS